MTPGTYDAKVHPSIRAIACLAVLVAVLSACSGLPFGGSNDTLVVRNRSDDTFYVRIESGPRTTITYVVGPRENGRAISGDRAARVTALSVYSADCEVFAESTDPPFGEMIFEGGGGITFSAGVPADAATLPLLTVDDSCV
jgi:hypothetical protein